MAAFTLWGDGEIVAGCACRRAPLMPDIADKVDLIVK
jgi:hypothetical protein